MQRTLLASMVILPLLAACGGLSGAGGVNCSEKVASPGGFVPKACVHEVPNGGSVTFGDGGTTVVSVNGQVVATYPPCPCTGTGPSPTCSDREGGTRALGESWTDGCMSCSCASLGGTPTTVCTHNACPPDASADTAPSFDSASCQSLRAAYETAESAARECTIDAGGQCGTMITRPFPCRCATFVNGAADGVDMAAAAWTGAGCAEVCTGACALATHAVCVADATSATGGRCADRDVAADPP